MAVGAHGLPDVPRRDEDVHRADWGGARYVDGPRRASVPGSRSLICWRRRWSRRVSRCSSPGAGRSCPGSRCPGRMPSGCSGASTGGRAGSGGGCWPPTASPAGTTPWTSTATPPCSTRSWRPGRSWPRWASAGSRWPTSACWPPGRPRGTCWSPGSRPWSTGAWEAGRWRRCRPAGCAARGWPRSRRRPRRSASASTRSPSRSAPSWPAATSRRAATRPASGQATTPSSCAGCCRTAPGRWCWRASPGRLGCRCGSTGCTWPPTPTSTTPACTPAHGRRGPRGPARPGWTSRPSPGPRPPACCTCARTPGRCPGWSSWAWPSWPASPCAGWSTRPGSTTCCATTAPSTSAPRSIASWRRPAWPSRPSAGSPTCRPAATRARPASS